MKKAATAITGTMILAALLACTPDMLGMEQPPMSPTPTHVFAAATDTTASLEPTTTTELAEPYAAPTFSPIAHPASPGDVLFHRFSAGEIWAISLDGTNAHHITDYELPPMTPLPNLSPDGRYMVLSGESPGAVLLDLKTGVRTPVESETWITSVAWWPDTEGLVFFAYRTVDNEPQYALWQLPVPPGNQKAVIIAENPAVAFRPVNVSNDWFDYPAPILGLMDERLLVQYSRGTSVVFDGLYDLATRTFTPLLYADESVNVRDFELETGQAAFSAPHAEGLNDPTLDTYHIGQMNPDGMLTDVHDIILPDEVEMHLPLELVPTTDTVIGLINTDADGYHPQIARFDLGSDGNYHPGEVVTPDDEERNDVDFMLADNEWIIVTRFNEVAQQAEPWRYALDGSEAKMLTSNGGNPLGLYPGD